MFVIVKKLETTEITFYKAFIFTFIIFFAFIAKTIHIKNFKSNPNFYFM